MMWFCLCLLVFSVNTLGMYGTAALDYCENNETDNGGLAWHQLLHLGWLCAMTGLAFFWSGIAAIALLKG